MSTSHAAAILDIDGTLVDSTYHHALAWHRAFGRYDVETPPMWRLHRSIGMGGDKLVAHVADDATEEKYGDRLRDSWREEYLSLRAGVRPLPGATALVQRLREDGFLVALASSGDPQFSEEAVAMLDIADDIDLLLTAEDVDASKPEPDLIEQTLARLSDVEHTVLVGDTVYDVQSAARAGLPCIALLCGGVGREELLAAGAVRVADDPSGLLDLRWAEVMARVPR